MINFYRVSKILSILGILILNIVNILTSFWGWGSLKNEYVCVTVTILGTYGGRGLRVVDLVGSVCGGWGCGRRLFDSPLSRMTTYMGVTRNSTAQHTKYTQKRILWRNLCCFYQKPTPSPTPTQPYNMTVFWKGLNIPICSNNPKFQIKMIKIGRDLIRFCCFEETSPRKCPQSWGEGLSVVFVRALSVKVIQLKEFPESLQKTRKPLTDFQRESKSKGRKTGVARGTSGVRITLPQKHPSTPLFQQPNNSPNTKEYLQK